MRLFAALVWHFNLPSFRVLLFMAIRYAEPKPKKAASPKRKGAGGRPRKADALVAVTLRVEPEVLEAWKAAGKGWRSRMAKAVGCP